WDNMYPTANYDPVCFDGTITNGTFCQTDNATLTWYSESGLVSNGNYSWYMTHDVDPTDLNSVHDTTPSYTGSAETDIIFQHRTDIPNSDLGIAWCNDAVSSWTCDQGYAAFAETNVGAAEICHEAGHDLGLTHGEDAAPAVSNQDSRLGCM